MGDYEYRKTGICPLNVNLARATEGGQPPHDFLTMSFGCNSTTRGRPA